MENDDDDIDRFCPSNLTDHEWQIIKEIAKHHWEDGKTPYCKASVLAFFDFLDMMVSPKDVVH